MDLSRITELSNRYLAYMGGNDLQLNRLSAVRWDAQSDTEVSVFEPALCLILKGSKEAITCGQSFRLSRGKALLISHDVRVLSGITNANASEPYPSLVLFLDLQLTPRASTALGDLDLFQT